MEVKINDILQFIRNWRNNKGIADDVKLTSDQITTFISELHIQIAQMDFSVLHGTTIIAYTGESNGVRAWEIADKVSENAGDNAMYISNLPAGELIGEYRPALERALENIVGDNTVYIDRIMGAVITKMASG